MPSTLLPDSSGLVTHERGRREATWGRLVQRYPREGALLGSRSSRQFLWWVNIDHGCVHCAPPPRPYVSEVDLYTSSGGGIRASWAGGVIGGLFFAIILRA